LILLTKFLIRYWPLWLDKEGKVAAGCEASKCLMDELSKTVVMDKIDGRFQFRCL
jgi:hypothetical protein